MKVTKWMLNTEVILVECVLCGIELSGVFVECVLWY